MSQRMKVVFSKTGAMRYISHLDLMRLFQRAARRAGIPFSLSKGYSPHPKISFRRALKLGQESKDEEASFLLEEWMEPEEFRKKLQAQLPQGISIVRCLRNKSCR